MLSIYRCEVPHFVVEIASFDAWYPRYYLVQTIKDSTTSDNTENNRKEERKERETVHHSLHLRVNECELHETSLSHPRAPLQHLTKPKHIIIIIIIIMR
jgi:hypothetical protein